MKTFDELYELRIHMSHDYLENDIKYSVLVVTKQRDPQERHLYTFLQSSYDMNRYGVAFNMCDYFGRVLYPENYKK